MLRILTDEDVHGDIVAGLLRRQPSIDLVRVQDVGLAHTSDPIILEWAAQQDRVVVSVDKKTLLSMHGIESNRDYPCPAWPSCD